MLHQLIDALVHGRSHGVNPVQPAQIVLGILPNLIVGHVEGDDLHVLAAGQAAGDHVDLIEHVDGLRGLAVENQQKDAAAVDGFDNAGGIGALGVPGSVPAAHAVRLQLVGDSLHDMERGCGMMADENVNFHVHTPSCAGVSLPPGRAGPCGCRCGACAIRDLSGRRPAVSRTPGRAALRSGPIILRDS